MQVEQIERICISVNTVCNLGCSYCYFFNPENHVNKEPHLSEEAILEILEKSHSYHIQGRFSKKIKVNFVGSGEPLIHWKTITNAVSRFHQKNQHQESLKFYTVTNGTLVTHEIAKRLKELNITPSVSIDGPESIHNKYRKYLNRTSSFNQAMRGVRILKDVGFDVAINTTITKDLINEIDSYFDFIIEEQVNKVIFDRLVDAPLAVETITYEEYYKFLLNVMQLIDDRKLSNLIEVGNLESYRRNYAKKPDKVCTMFGGSCGAGTNFLIYMGNNVYPCGRMFGQPKWLLGHASDSIKTIQSKMFPLIPQRSDCHTCDVSDMCVRDCLLEFNTINYSCDSRKEFLRKFTQYQSKN